MPQFERRLYEPSDDLQPFDGDEDMEDEGSRLPLLIGIALIVLLSFAGVVWLAYTQGVQRGRADAPQIAGTQHDTNLASIDQKPTPYSKLRIYQPPKSDEDSASDDPAPPPSAVTAPNISSAAPPSTGKTESGTGPGKQTEALKSAGTESAAPAAEPANATAHTAAGAPQAITPPPSASSAKPAKATVEPKAASVVSKTSAKPPAPKPAATAGTSKLPEPKPVAVKSPPPKPVTITPAKAVSAEVPKAKASEAKVAALTPQATPPAATTAPAATPAPDTTPKVASGSFLLQIGSYKSDSEANASWQTYKGAHGSVAGYSPDVRKVELGAKGTWYRLRIGPFASLAEANAACVKLKAQGGNCFPARQ